MNVADSMWVSVTNWFTPTVLFCILNLTIGTIFVSSSFKKKDDNHEHEGTTLPQLVRTPSLLERVKSINFSFRRSDQPYPFPSVAQYVDSHEDQEHQVEEAHEVHSESHHIMRSQSETTVEVPSMAATRKMKKSASEKVVSLNKDKEEEEAEVVDRSRPATVRERKAGWSQNHEEDEAVDKKADDFINRFRQQLKIQRLDSILRYREMLNRGAGR